MRPNQKERNLAIIHSTKGLFLSSFDTKICCICQPTHKSVKAVIEVGPDPKNRMVKIIFKKGAVLVSKPQFGKDDIRMITCADPNVFHRISGADWQKATEDGETLLRQTAIDDGIMDKTVAEARAVLTTFLQSLGYASQIEFEDK